MSGYGDSPSPPPSDDGSYEGSDASDSSAQPRYTPEELRALFVDFYEFLTTLHYVKANLKIPPPIGWPHITPESCAHFKSDHAIEVLRHLPYFDHTSVAYVQPKSRLLDFTEFTHEKFKMHKEEDEKSEFWSSEDEVDPSDVVCISEGRESGSDLFLVVKECEIIEELGEGCGTRSAVPIETFFDNLKEQYRTLKLIPGRCRNTIEAQEVPEIEKRITEDEVHVQTEDWGTDLDIQYIRQVYRDHGWPESFRLQEASKVINNWQNAVKAGPRRFAWEGESD